jgi:hypothetical protein
MLHGLAAVVCCCVLLGQLQHQLQARLQLRSSKGHACCRHRQQ